MSEDSVDDLIVVAVDKISLSPHQPRRHFAKEELEELSQSILSVGIIHPPVVRFIASNNQYELVSGERRLRAAQLAGLQQIAVIVQKRSSMSAAQSALIENIQRVDLNPLEIAKALKALLEKFGWTQEELAKRIGKKRSTVANYLRLLTLSKEIQDSLTQGKITMGHAKAILSVADSEKQKYLHESLLRDDLTVRKAERAASQMGTKTKKNAAILPQESDCFIEDLTTKLQQILGTKVMFMSSGTAGKICIDYYSLDDLDRILSILVKDSEIPYPV